MEFTDIGRSIFVKYPLSPDRVDLKLSSIQTALTLGDKDLLASLVMTCDGLLTKELRQKIWRLFLGVEKESLPRLGEDVAHHKDEHQVELDVARSFSSYPENRSLVGGLRHQLQRLITSVLRRHPQLSYYQGYHDIAQVILLVYEDLDQAEAVLDALTMIHLRDYMMPGIEAALPHLELVKQAIGLKDAGFYRVISLLPPYYALLSVITLFTHDLNSFEQTCWALDFLILCANTHGSVACAAAALFALVTCSRKTDILGRVLETCTFGSNSLTSEGETLVDSTHSDASDMCGSEMLYRTASLTDLLEEGLEPGSADVLHNALLHVVSEFGRCSGPEEFLAVLSSANLLLIESKQWESGVTISQYSVLRTVHQTSALSLDEILERQVQDARREAEKNRVSIPRKSRGMPGFSLMNAWENRLIRASVVVGVIGVLLRMYMGENGGIEGALKSPFIGIGRKLSTWGWW